MENRIIQTVLDDVDLLRFQQVIEITGLSRSATGAMLIRFGLDIFLAKFTIHRDSRLDDDADDDVSCGADALDTCNDCSVLPAWEAPPGEIFERLCCALELAIERGVFGSGTAQELRCHLRIARLAQAHWQATKLLEQEHMAAALEHVAATYAQWQEKAIITGVSF
jgi:hypothetical protein